MRYVIFLAVMFLNKIKNASIFTDGCIKSNESSKVTTRLQSYKRFFNSQRTFCSNQYKGTSSSEECRKYILYYINYYRYYYLLYLFWIYICYYFHILNSSFSHLCQIIGQVYILSNHTKPYG